MGAAMSAADQQGLIIGLTVGKFYNYQFLKWNFK